LILRGLAQALEGRDRLTAEEFQHWAQPLVQHLKIQAVGWVPRVAAAERPLFESELRRVGTTNFVIFERDQSGKKVLAAKREAYFPVLYSEPRQGNEDWIGYDLGSEPRRRQALWETLRTGLSAATDPWESPEGKGDQSEFLACYPVYRAGSTTENNAARWSKVPAGFIVAVLRCDALLEQAMAASAVEPGLTRVEEFQIDPELGPRWLASWPQSPGRAVNPKSRSLAPHSGELAVVRPVFAFGKTYTLLVKPGPAFLAGYPHQHSWMLGLAGLLLSMTITTLVGVTRRRQAYLRQQLLVRTKALRANAERLQMYWHAIEQSPASVLIADCEGAIEYVNPKFLEVTGYTMAEIIGQNPRLLKSGQMSNEFYQEMWRTLNAGRNWSGEICNRRKDGALYWESALISPIRNQQGVVTRYLAIKENITARKQAESELQETNEQLEQASARANQMALEAELASITKSQFLANMSHEIRTPMNGIIGMTDLLLETKLTPEQKEFATIARNSSQTLLGLLNDILDFSKIEAGKMQLEKLDFNLRTALEDAVEMLAVKAAEKSLELACLMTPDLPLALKGDPARLRQILVNLGSNAIKFTRQGEVILRAELVARDAGRVTIRFAVSDTGIGIPAARLDALFKPFTQVDGSTTRKYGGTGLGLAISKQFSELMGGQIGVESKEGQGSTFWFTAVLDEQAAAQGEEVSSDSPLNHLRVLLIDHHQVSRQAASTYLRGWGCEVVEAGDGQTALDQLAEAARQGQPFPVALVNRSLPDLDGVELGQKIAGDPVLCTTRLIMAAALDKRNDRAQLQQMGFAAVLTKPIRHQALHNCLQAVLTAPQLSAPALTPGASGDTVLLAQPDRHRLLLVDDNVTNQTVAGKILNKLGYEVDLAGSGQEALQAMGATHYSLVLMDCQMPELDGFEVTRRIRSGQAGVLDPKVPIIAMTARTLQGDRELCLQAGMDDYLTKPIDRRALADTLDRWLEHKTPIPRVTMPASPPPSLASEKPATAELGAKPETVPAFDGKGFLERLMGDLDLADMVATTYLGDIPNQFQALSQAIEEGKAPAAGAIAHRIKGATANVGGVALQQLAHKMEAAGKADDLSTLQILLPEAKTQLQLLLQILQKKEWHGAAAATAGT